MERRRELRFPDQLAILVWGVDTKGTKFAQQAQACNISRRGALLSGLEQPLRFEDLVGVQYRQRQAKFRVVWLRDSRGPEKIVAAVERLPEETCPWPEELVATPNSPERPQPDASQSTESGRDVSTAVEVHRAKFSPRSA